MHQKAGNYILLYQKFSEEGPQTLQMLHTHYKSFHHPSLTHKCWPSYTVVLHALPSIVLSGLPTITNNKSNVCNILESAKKIV